MLLWSVLHHEMNYTEAFKKVKTKHRREKNIQSCRRLPLSEGNNSICESISKVIQSSINMRPYCSLLGENQLGHNTNSYRTYFLITLPSFLQLRSSSWNLRRTSEDELCLI